MNSGCYYILGEIVRCDYDLSAVVPVVQAQPSIHVHTHPATATSEDVARELAVHANPARNRIGPIAYGDRYRVFFPNDIDAEVDVRNRRIHCHIFPGSRAMTAHRIANHILPMLLMGLGELIIHASSVERDGRAIAFLGPSGRGKSTLAASFVNAGWQAISDDSNRVCTIENSGGVLGIQAHYTGFRLLEESVRGLGIDETFEADGKHFHSIGSGIQVGETVPLSAIFVLLGPASSISIRRLVRAQAFREVMAETFSLDMRDQQQVSRRFEDVDRVAASVPTYTLSYPREMSVFPDLHARIADVIS